MQDVKKQAFIRLFLIGLAMILFIGGAVYFNNIILKIIFGLLGAAVAAFLLRIIISYRRKKLYFDGKVISVTKPKNRISKYTIVIKKGKVSKKFYSYTNPNFTVGKSYVVVYEDKSLLILDSQEAKFQMAGAGALGKNPKYRM